VKLRQTFIDFLHRLPFYGRAILCNEDARVRLIMPFVQRPIVTYGLSADSDIYAKDVKAQSGQMHFTVCIRELNLEYPIKLNLPGIHNVLNALATIAVGMECEGNIESIAKALENFHGVGRRCQHYPEIKHEGKSAILIDDYGHHPVELRATLSALRGAYPTKRLVLLFQPHRYTRTRDLFDDFVTVLSSVDQLIVLEVYAAGESPVPLADGRSLVRAVRLQGNVNTIFASDLDEAKNILLNILADDDLVVTMGAGSIGKLPQMLVDSNKE
jgi:UDP-N-acetylmuramate--alanine ligase